MDKVDMDSIKHRPRRKVLGLVGWFAFWLGLVVFFANLGGADHTNRVFTAVLLSATVSLFIGFHVARWWQTIEVTSPSSGAKP